MSEPVDTPRVPEQSRGGHAGHAGPPRRPLKNFLTLLWQAPLVAVPFGLFFGMIYGARTTGDFLFLYRMALTFSASVSLSIWVLQNLLPPRWLDGGRRDVRSVLRITLLYAAAAFVGTYAAVLVFNTLVKPGALSGARTFLTIGMFAVLFLTLFVAVSFAVSFYRDAVARARSEEELTLSRKIQRSFLVTEFPEIPGFDVHAVNLSSREVSGDFYDVVPTGNGDYLIAIADVSGKGFPAALLSSMLQASLRTQADGPVSVARVMRNINRLAHRSTHVEQFATFFLARVDTAGMTISFTNAGHNFPVLFQRRGARLLLETGGPIVGAFGDIDYSEETVPLVPGDRLVLYTDGVTEAQARPDGEFFGEERLYDVIGRVPPHTSARGIVEAIVADLRRFLNGAEAQDDVTVLVLTAVEAGKP